MCNSAKVNRWFWKCDDCLRVVATDVELAGVDPRCGACEGRMDRMGRVSGERLVKDEVRCPCDARCTGAKGPLCSCSCGGENHGSGMVEEVAIDAGAVPVIGKQTNAECMAIADEWRAALAPLAAERDALLREKQAGWIERAKFDRLCELGRLIGHARNLRTHKGRMKVLLSLAKA